MKQKCLSKRDGGSSSLKLKWTNRHPSRKRNKKRKEIVGSLLGLLYWSSQHPLTKQHPKNKKDIEEHTHKKKLAWISWRRALWDTNHLVILGPPAGAMALEKTRSITRNVPSSGTTPAASSGPKLVVSSTLGGIPNTPSRHSQVCWSSNTRNRTTNKLVLPPIPYTKNKKSERKINVRQVSENWEGCKGECQLWKLFCIQLW